MKGIRVLQYHVQHIAVTMWDTLRNSFGAGGEVDIAKVCCCGTDGGLRSQKVDESINVDDWNRRQEQRCGLLCNGARRDNGAHTRLLYDHTIAFDGMTRIQGRVGTARGEDA